MKAADRLEKCLGYFASDLESLAPTRRFVAICTGLMLPGLAEALSPLRRVGTLFASERHQSLHPFVAKPVWSDAQMLRRVCRLCLA